MGTIFKRNIVLGPDADPQPPTLSELFHENTKMHPDAAVGGALAAEYSLAEEEVMASVGQVYHRAPQFKLPVDDLGDSSVSLETAIIARRTSRTFAPVALTAGALSKLLFLTGGITTRLETESGLVRELRAAPSGGALYPVEVYVAVRNVEGVPAGVYHYAPRRHSLEQLEVGDPTEALVSACHYRESLEGAAAIIVFAGVLQRTKRKYGDRGYRLILLEAGHMAQNLCLGSAALGLGCMNVCGFFDDRLNALLRLDGVDEAALYVAYVGGLPDEHEGD